MAKNEPITTTQTGVAGGTFIAISRPVITAEPSAAFIFLFIKD